MKETDMENKSGGPAFPIMGGLCDFEFTGLTLRAYFAARAPSCPEWFKHEPDSPHPRVPKEGQVSPLQMFEAITAEKKWQARQQAAKFFEWRKFYADCMVAEFSA